MQKPPTHRSPHILFARSTNEWINQVTQKHNQFLQLHLFEEEKADVENRVEIEFVYSTLKLENFDISREQVARTASRASDNAGAVNEQDLPVFALLRAIRRVKESVKTSGDAAQLTPELLIELNNLAGGGSGFRKTASDADHALKLVPAEHLPAVIENACRWYTAESFAELNPIEQASIVFLRLIEIQPFERANLRTALAAASLFTLRSTLPPVILKPECGPAFFNAVEESRRTNTKPMVELMADAAQITLGEMIDKSKRQR